jgi:hypothetical protein
VFVLGLQFVARLGGITIEGREFSIFEFGTTDKIRQHARKTAENSCARDVSNLSQYFSTLASLSEMLTRPSTLDDSEQQVARRLAASFFLMGFLPIRFDAQSRLLIFTDGDEKILIRFRHRTGISTNVTFVEKLVSLMQVNHATRSYLFCSPGLSGNAARLADENKVKWYTLDSMNQWIEQVLVSDYGGPAGDVLVNLDNLKDFFATLSPALTTRTYRSSYRHYRSSRRW